MANQKQNSEQTVIELGKKVLILEIKDFGSSEINIEDLLQIQLNDVVMDIITFPVIFNRIANIKAEADDLLRQVTLDQKIFEAQLYEKHKKVIVALNGKATEAAIEAAVVIDPQYKIKKLHVFKVQKQADILDALYWSAKSKDQKLNAVSAKLKPEEFEKEILEGTINSVMIKVKNNLFENKRK